MINLYEFCSVVERKNRNPSGRSIKRLLDLYFPHGVMSLVIRPDVLGHSKFPEFFIGLTTLEFAGYAHSVRCIVDSYNGMELCHAMNNNRDKAFNVGYLANHKHQSVTINISLNVPYRHQDKLEFLFDVSYKLKGMMEKITAIGIDEIITITKKLSVDDETLFNELASGQYRNSRFANGTIRYLASYINSFVLEPCILAFRPGNSMALSA